MCPLLPKVFQMWASGQMLGPPPTASIHRTLLSIPTSTRCGGVLARCDRILKCAPPTVLPTIQTPNSFMCPGAPTLLLSPRCATWLPRCATTAPYPDEASFSVSRAENRPLPASPNVAPTALSSLWIQPCLGGNRPAPTCSLPRRSPAGPIHLLVRGGGRRGAPLPPASLAPSLRASGCAPSPTRPRAAAGEGVVGRGGLSGGAAALPRRRAGAAGPLGRAGAAARRSAALQPWRAARGCRYWCCWRCSGRSLCWASPESASACASPRPCAACAASMGPPAPAVPRPARPATPPAWTAARPAGRPRGDPASAPVSAGWWSRGRGSQGEEGPRGWERQSPREREPRFGVHECWGIPGVFQEGGLKIPGVWG